MARIAYSAATGQSSSIGSEMVVCSHWFRNALGIRWLQQSCLLVTCVSQTHFCVTTAPHSIQLNVGTDDVTAYTISASLSVTNSTEPLSSLLRRLTNLSSFVPAQSLQYTNKWTTEHRKLLFVSTMDNFLPLLLCSLLEMSNRFILASIEQESVLVYTSDLA